MVEPHGPQQLDVAQAGTGAEIEIVAHSRALVVGAAAQAGSLEVLAGDHVDHAQQRVGAVEHRGRTLDDLDVVDRGEGDQLRSQPVARGEPEGDRVPVDHHLDGAALPPQSGGDAPHPGVGDDEVVDDVEARRVLQDLGDRAKAPAAEVVTRDHGDHRGANSLDHLL